MRGVLFPKSGIVEERVGGGKEKGNVSAMSIEEVWR